MGLCISRAWKFADDVFLQDVAMFQSTPPRVCDSHAWHCVVTEERRDLATTSSVAPQQWWNDTKSFPSQTDISIKYGEEKKGLWGVSRHGEVGRDAPSHLLFNVWQPEHSNMRFWKVCFHKINTVFCSSCSSLMESRVAEGGGNGGERTGLRRKD